MSTPNNGREKIEILIGPAIVNGSQENKCQAIVPARPRKKPGLLKRVAASIALGIEHSKSTSSELLPRPVPIEQNERAQKWDERMMGDGLPVEQSRGGMDYVMIENEMVALQPNAGRAVSFDDEDKEKGVEVVLTEDGPRILDRAYDFVNEPPCVFEMVWKDPDTGAIRKMPDLPRNHMQGSNTVTFLRDGKKVVAPLFTRRWQKD